MYGVVYAGAFEWTNALHENLHTMGAVQPTAPHGTVDYHCTQGSDYLCPQYNADCTQVTRIDCLHDDYFNLYPFGCSNNPPGYLCNHWNLAHVRNHFISIANDCGTQTDAGANFAAATYIGTPQSNCTAAISYAENGGIWADYYRFDVVASDKVHVWMQPNAKANFDLALIDPDNTGAWVSQNVGLGSAEGIDITAAKSGQYRVGVYVPSGRSDTGSYSLTLCKNC